MTTQDTITLTLSQSEAELVKVALRMLVASTEETLWFRRRYLMTTDVCECQMGTIAAVLERLSANENQTQNQTTH